MAVPDRYYGPLFDKISDSWFWARATRAIRAAARTRNMPWACSEQSLRHRHPFSWKIIA